MPKIGKSERTRAAILDAAFEFLWSRPYREMTVNLLMGTTDASRSAFYQYFRDLPELMQTLLDTLAAEIMQVADPWLNGVGDPVALLTETLTGLVDVCYKRGPFIKAIADAAPTEKRLEEAWNAFLGGFDDVVTERISADQALGLIAEFESRPLAIALNRLDAYAFIQAFGERPRGQAEPVRDAILRLWISALYGQEWLKQRQSSLRRQDGAFGKDDG